MLVRKLLCKKGNQHRSWADETKPICCQLYPGCVHSWLDFVHFLTMDINFFLPFIMHHIPIRFMTILTCISVTAFGEAIFHISLSKPSQDVCFWRVLICILNIPNAGHLVNFWYTYMNDFYFHCHDKDLWSSLLCRLYRWWKKWATFFFFFSLYNTAIVLCCIPPTRCKVLLLYYYYYRWVGCLETKCRFHMETDSLESI